jgi:tRNA dimethylallyltransferase
MQPFLRILAGPTASGKSELALTLAKRLNAEILSADSQQVYRHFDIGTAKPSPQVLAEVPHHLISVVEPMAQFSAADFQRLADLAIANIASRGRPILVVGGTGLYLRVLLRGMISAPGADRSLRLRLEGEAREQGRDALYQRLCRADPESASAINPGDLVRIIRALEIAEKTGRKASEIRDQHRFETPRYPYAMLVLDPPREVLYAAIDARTKAMFAGGLLEEVTALVKRGLRDAPAMRSVGYVQALAVLERRIDVAGAIASAAKETRHYAKRQLTWFRKEPGAQFVWPAPVDAFSQAE